MCIVIHLYLPEVSSDVISRDDGCSTRGRDISYQDIEGGSFAGTLCEKMIQLQYVNRGTYMYMYIV